MRIFSDTPFLLLALVTGTAIFLGFHYEKVQQNQVVNSDGYAYYSYLPAWFVHGSTDFAYYKDLDPEDRKRVWVRPGREGKYLPKMSMGLAYAWVPGFLGAHAVAGWLGFPRDGWSLPYQLAVMLSGVFFLVTGMFFTWHWLRFWVSSLVASVTVLLLLFATNMLHYSGPQVAFSHVYSFALIAVCLWITYRWLARPKVWHYLLLGLLIGRITLIRPTNGIIALLPALLALWQGKWRSHLLHPAVLPAALCFALPWIPQLLFWKDVTGHWLHYSYGSEQIFWLRPHILDGLWSFRNGWLIYTPVMAFALAGLALLWRLDRRWGVTITLLVVMHVYVVFSWWCWYYGDSLSIRPMIDIYALLALPLALVLRWVAVKQFRWWLPAMLLMVLLVWNNLVQTDQYNRGFISGSAMTQQAFYTLLFNHDPPRHLAVIGAYRVPDTDRLRLGLPEREQRDTIVEKTIIHVDFDQTGTATGLKGRSLRLTSDMEYSEAFTTPAAGFETPFDRTLRCKAWVKSVNTRKTDASLVLSFEDGDKIHGYYTVELHALGLKNDTWSEVSLFVRKPPYLPDSGIAKTYFWLRNGPDLLIDELTLEQLDCPYTEPLLIEGHD